MDVLVLSQKISDLHMDIIENALPNNCQITIITGSVLERHPYIEAPAHDPNSLVSRLKCWYQYYHFVYKWGKTHKESKYDLIFATSNPPINAALGVRLKKLYKSKFAYMNWDLYPQVIETSMKGFVSRVFSWGWHRLNNLIYPKIDQMITIGSVMADSINEPLKKKINVEIIPMFTDTKRLKPISRVDNSFCIEHRLVDKFVVLYSGKMGLGHNLEILLESSEHLRNQKDILFLFIGHGQKYSYIENWIKKKQAENVRIMPLQPEAIFPLSMASGCIGFISQEKNAAKCFMPAKTYDMMACGMPIIAYSEGTDDLSSLVKNKRIGISMSSNSPQDLASYIMKLYNDKKLYEEFSVNSRRIAIEEFDIIPVTEKYRKCFMKLL